MNNSIFARHYFRRSFYCIRCFVYIHLNTCIIGISILNECLCFIRQYSIGSISKHFICVCAHVGDISILLFDIGHFHKGDWIFLIELNGLFNVCFSYKRISNTSIRYSSKCIEHIRIRKFTNTIGGPFKSLFISTSLLCDMNRYDKIRYDCFGFLNQIF